MGEGGTAEIWGLGGDTDWHWLGDSEKRKRQSNIKGTNEHLGGTHREAPERGNLSS